MSGDTMIDRPRRHQAAKMRVHDYLYDSAYIVSGARDYARTAFKAAMASAQVVIQPVFNNMFSEARVHPRLQVVYHPNCRLPDHVDRSYGAYLHRQREAKSTPLPQLSGRDMVKFNAVPRKLLPLQMATPIFRPPSPTGPSGPTKPRNRGTQSVFRESSAQTIPWQPDAVASKQCEKTPEVLYLEKLGWGPGNPYRTGDLPADFHTTEIINKLRHARMWTDLVERGKFPRWMKKRDAIISDLETKDWIFREAEIDELQSIRLELLHRMQTEQREKACNKTSKKLAHLWALKKQEMERKVEIIRKTRDREHRKLVAIHEGGGRAGLVARMRSARGMGGMLHACVDPTSDLHAPLARHGYQARRRHAQILYDPALLSLEDHKAISEPPAWLDSCGQNLKKTCSGHNLLRDPNVLCERETKWSEQFLENLHNDLKKARLGAATMTAGPLHVLKPRKEVVVERPQTPEVESVDDYEETAHQAALTLQRIIRGRAVQYLMYEGRTRAAELTEELKTTHGLQKEDKIRISREEAKSREFNARRTESEQKDDAITALVDELCGGAVSAALDFLEKELRRLKEERRQHAFLLIALREKTMREAAEAGRRQREEHRRREHDEMFKQILGVTQGTVDAYLNEIIDEGVELAAEEDATARAKAQAAKYNAELIENEELTTAETNELVAELVQQFLLPHAHKTATRMHISMLQNATLEAARHSIFGLLDEAEYREAMCVTCGHSIGDLCRCKVMRHSMKPMETDAREDKRWKYARQRPKAPPKTWEERFPVSHDIRCMMTDLINDVVVKSRRDKAERSDVGYEMRERISEKMEIELDIKHICNFVVDLATGAKHLPVKQTNYWFTMRKILPGISEREKEPEPASCPKELPSEIRRKAEEANALPDDYNPCKCAGDEDGSAGKTKSLEGEEEEEKRPLLPSQLRQLEMMMRCKCDVSPETEPAQEEEYSTYSNTTAEPSEAEMSPDDVIKDDDDN